MFFISDSKMENLYKIVTEPATTSDYVTADTLSTLAPEVKPPPEPLEIVADNLFFYGFPVVITIGILGNIASFILMQTSPVRKLSISVYLSALACGDSAALVYVFLRLWLAPYYVGFHMFYRSDISRKLEMIFRRIVYVFPSWIIVSVSAERLLVTVRPLLAATANLRKRAMIVVASVLLVSIGYGFGEILPLGIAAGPCQREKYYFWIRKLNGKWVMPILYTYTPSGFILLFSVATSSVLLYKSRRLRAMTRSQNATLMSVKASRTVLAVAVCYLLLTLPGTILYPLSAKHRLKPGGARGVLALMVAICRLMQFSNHSINFFLYVATGESFRAPLGRMLCCGRGGGEGSSVRTSSSGTGRTNRTGTLSSSRGTSSRGTCRSTREGRERRGSSSLLLSPASPEDNSRARPAGRPEREVPGKERRGSFSLLLSPASPEDTSRGRPGKQSPRSEVPAGEKLGRPGKERRGSFSLLLSPEVTSRARPGKDVPIGRKDNAGREVSGRQASVGRKVLMPGRKEKPSRTQGTCGVGSTRGGCFMSKQRRGREDSRRWEYIIVSNIETSL